jgi:hypothetical protein
VWNASASLNSKRRSRRPPELRSPTVSRTS